MEPMADPLTALIIAAVIIGLIVLMYYPEKGLRAWWSRIRKNSERVLIEDALKHIYDCEHSDIDCTLRSIAGSLSISGDRTARLTEKLIALGLIESGTGSIELTSEGRSYALRIIRTHRLWERYLADETGVQEKDWHTEAERKEHVISPDEANELAAQLGHPLTDPHGDPIPSQSGTVVGKPAVPINDLKPGVYAHIVHIEDEPETIYSQLVAQGLHTGMQVRILDRTENSITIEADGNECMLAPLFAAQIQVRPIVMRTEVQHSFTPLSVLKEGEEAYVVALSKKIRGQQRRRLMDLGLVPGTPVAAILKSPGGDPVAYRIRGALIALRRTQTDGIFIRRKEVEDNGNK
jgi:DtxR family transcriptional regulator, Mn-dependent transcriptional regulator